MWIKVHDTLLDHRKLRRTAKLLLISEVTLRGHLVTLWLNVLRHSPDGDMDDWTEEDIAHYADWDGDPGLLVSSLAETQWIDIIEDRAVIHDWDEHSERLRISKIRKQNRERQAKHRKKTLNVNGITVTNALVTRDVTLDNGGEERRGEERKGEEKRGEKPMVLLVFEHYRKYHPRAHKKPHCKMQEWKKIQARLGEGYTIDDLKLAIDGCHMSPYHQGENDGGRKYDTLELIVRDGSKVNQFIEIANTKGPVTKASRKKSLRATSSWLDRGKRDAP